MPPRGQLSPTHGNMVSPPVLVLWHRSQKCVLPEWSPPKKRNKTKQCHFATASFQSHHPLTPGGHTHQEDIHHNSHNINLSAQASRGRGGMHSSPKQNQHAMSQQYRHLNSLLKIPHTLSHHHDTHTQRETPRPPQSSAHTSTSLSHATLATPQKQGTFHTASTNAHKVPSVDGALATVSQHTVRTQKLAGVEVRGRSLTTTTIPSKIRFLKSTHQHTTKRNAGDTMSTKNPTPLLRRKVRVVEEWLPQEKMPQSDYIAPQIPSQISSFIPLTPSPPPHTHTLSLCNSPSTCGTGRS